MIVTVMVLALAMAGAKADPQDDARKAFNNCLIEEHNSAVAAKKSGQEFNEQLANACTDTRKTYYDLVVKSERAFGSKQAEAEEYATEEIQSMIDSITGAFGDNVSTGAKLTPAK
jgi:protein-disulfide isomerase-like protein with CxxC motif